MRAAAAWSGVILLALGAYVWADVEDLAPGVLTRDAPPVATAPVTAGPTTSPTLPLPTAAPSAATTANAAQPDPALLTSRIAPALKNAWLGPSVGVSIGDAEGRTLYAKDADTPRTPASTAKLLTAAAVGSTVTPQTTMTTAVVRGARPDEIVLVAGGDTMLAPGKGDPAKVEGRAGLGDLAIQVATRLGASSSAPRPVTLRLDTTYAKGAPYAPGWVPADIENGFTQGVFMLGLAGQRPKPYEPSPRDPEAAVAAAFVTALKAHGVSATLAPKAAWTTAAPAGAEQLGAVRSAPVADVLALAMDDSDNALTENLARQATVRAGRPATFDAAVAWVRETDEKLGLDLAGATLKDTCGLTSGQQLPVRLLGDVLRLGVSGTQPALRAMLSQLPVAGVDGTLHDRFLRGDAHAAAGIARAKTGTLTGTSALAGTVVDANGQLLTFAVIADQVPASTGTLGARAALDGLVAALASCGCTR